MQVGFCASRNWVHTGQPHSCTQGSPVESKILYTVTWSAVAGPSRRPSSPSSILPPPSSHRALIPARRTSSSVSKTLFFFISITCLKIASVGEVFVQRFSKYCAVVCKQLFILHLLHKPQCCLYLSTYIYKYIYCMLFLLSRLSQRECLDKQWIIH